MADISFNVPRDALDHISTILARADELGIEHPFDRVSAVMDLKAAHANGCPLDFERLASADDFTLVHDVSGIYRHMDRETGQLMNCFRPRCALPAQAAE